MASVSNVKRSPELIDAILGTLRRGKSLRGSCGDHGLYFETWYQWEKDTPELLIQRKIAISRGMGGLEDEYLTTADAVRAKVLAHRLGKLDRDEWGTEQTITHEGMTLAAAVKARKDADDRA